MKNMYGREGFRPEDAVSMEFRFYDLCLCINQQSRRATRPALIEKVEGIILAYPQFQIAGIEYSDAVTVGKIIQHNFPSYSIEIDEEVQQVLDLPILTVTLKPNYLRRLR